MICKKFIAAAVTATLASVAMPANAVELVTNGGFETLTNGLGQLGFNTIATGWTSLGYNFVFDGATSDSVGSSGVYGGLTFWGPASGSNNGLVASPVGGNFVGADGAFGVAPVQQILTGLTAGKSYHVGFYWAGIQQHGFDGAQTEQWEVSLGGAPSQSTAIYANANHGFSGWFHERYTFVADSTTATLSFLAHGTPDGVPPFSLLDGVSVSAVPEPSSWAMLISGLGFVGLSLRRRRVTALAA